MRFSEFKILLEEARKIYAIGDSHAEGISYDKRIINRANGGQPSTSKTNYGGTHTITGAPVGLANIPKNQVVIISQGANDTATSIKGAINSNGKVKPVKPEVIAANVKKVVDAAKADGHTVIFLLFPNGPGRGTASLAKYYGGDYQEEVRSAIRSVVGVPIVDLGDQTLSKDGIHSTPSGYKAAAQQAISLISGETKIDKPTSDVKPNAPSRDSVRQSGKPAGEITVPASLYKKSEEVRKIQAALTALGYKLPKYGEDSIFGPETAGAVRRFQRANGLKVDGDPGPETVAKLNQLVGSSTTAQSSTGVTPVAYKPEKDQPSTRSLTSRERLAGKAKERLGKDKPTQSGIPSRPGRIVPQDSISIGPNAKGQYPTPSGKLSVDRQISPSQVSAYLKTQGLSKNHILGILVNIQAESGFNAAAQNPNDGPEGASWGLFQHNGIRRLALYKKLGNEWWRDWEGQLEFALDENEGRQYISMNFSSPEAAARWFTVNFERPQHKEQRASERASNLKSFEKFV